MTRICPLPGKWNEVFQSLERYARSNPCIPPSPPTPMILAGWAYSNDVVKKLVWEATVDWAEKNGCSELISCITDEDFYFVDAPSTYQVGPYGGPMYLDWDFSPKKRPTHDDLDKDMEILLSRWSDIVGEEIAKYTRPLRFTGKKARRLLISANASISPPWGGWSYLSHGVERRNFTSFRSAINKAIAPHGVDHIDFVTDGDFEQLKS